MADKVQIKIQGKALSLREAETKQKATPSMKDIMAAKRLSGKIGKMVKAMAEARELAG